MRTILLLLVVNIWSSCAGQQLVQTLSDMPKLKQNESKFVNQPLSDLLKSIKPSIKSALGNPEEASESKLATISFYFTTKEEFGLRRKNGEDPSRILVTLMKPKGKEYPAINPSENWSKDKEKIYGDMIVVRISVLGKD